MSKPVITRVKGDRLLSISISLSKEIATKVLRDLLARYGDDIKIKITESGSIDIEIEDNSNGNDKSS